MMSDSKFKSLISKWFFKVEKSEKGKPVLENEPAPVDTEKTLMALRDSVTKFENPTEPIDVDDWEALKGNGL